MSIAESKAVLGSLVDFMFRLGVTSGSSVPLKSTLSVPFPSTPDPTKGFIPDASGDVALSRFSLKLAIACSLINDCLKTFGCSINFSITLFRWFIPISWAK